MARGSKRGGRGGGRVGAQVSGRRRKRGTSEVEEPAAEAGEPAAEVGEHAAEVEDLEVDDTQLTIQQHIAADIAKGKKKVDDQAKEAAEKVDMYGKFIISKPRNIREAVCWAVAITEVVEAHYNIGKKEKEAEYLKLSPQFLLNEVRRLEQSIRNFGKAADILFTHGLPSESKVPYGVANSSKGHRSKMVKVLQYTDIDAESQDITDDMVMEILDKGNGPVVLVFDVDESLSALRAEEIYQCPEVDEVLPHAVVVVGYGEVNGEKYWHIRNCYGPGWCKQGYGKFSRRLKILKLWYPEEVK